MNSATFELPPTVAFSPPFMIVPATLTVMNVISRFVRYSSEVAAC